MSEPSRAKSMVMGLARRKAASSPGRRGDRGSLPAWTEEGTGAGTAEPSVSMSMESIDGGRKTPKERRQALHRRELQRKAQEERSRRHLERTDGGEAFGRTKRLANTVGQMLATDGDGDYDGDEPAVDLLASGTSVDWSSGLPSPALSASESASASASTALANGGNHPTPAAPRTMSVSPMFSVGAGNPPSAENGEEEDGEDRSKSPPAIRAQPSPGRAHAARSSTNERLTNILQYLDDVEQDGGDGTNGDSGRSSGTSPARSVMAHLRESPGRSAGRSTGSTGRSSGRSMGSGRSPHVRGGGRPNPSRLLNEHGIGGEGENRGGMRRQRNQGGNHGGQGEHRLDNRGASEGSAGGAGSGRGGGGNGGVGGGGGGSGEQQRAPVYDWEVESDTRSVVSAASTRFFTTDNVNAHTQGGGGNTSLLSATAPSVASVYGGVKAKLSALTIEVEDKARTIAALKEALHTARRAGKTTAEQMQAEEQARASAVRSEYESSVSRHLTMIDELLNDKKVLSGECARLAQQGKSTAEQYDHKIIELNNRHKDGARKQREAAAANDRARLEQWEREQTKKIKQMTIKGLEPEIQRLLSMHKTELKRMEQRHGDTLSQLRDELGRRGEQGLLDERAERRDELEQAVRRERAGAEQQLQEVGLRHERALATERKSFHEEQERARSRFDGLLEQNRRRQAEEMEQQRAQHAKEIDTLQRRVVAEREAENRRQGADVRSAREAELIEREQWQQRMLAKLRGDVAEKEKALKATMEAHRDAQIEMVIKRLDDETAAARDEMEDKFQRETDQVMNSHTAEVRAARQAAAEQAERCNALIKAHSGEVGEAEGQAAALRERVGELTRQVEAARGEVERARGASLQQEKERLREFSQRREVDAKDARSRQEQVRGQLDKWQTEAQRLKEAASASSEDHQRELDHVHDRVRSTIARRDETIRSLRTQLDESELKAHNTEQLLEKQRQEMLG